MAYLKMNAAYQNYSGDIAKLYGKGFSYTKIIPDLSVNRENIERRILDKEFDVIIYGSVHRGMPYHQLVLNTYEPEKIVYICGEDKHFCSFPYLHNFFLREFESLH